MSVASVLFGEESKMIVCGTGLWPLSRTLLLRVGFPFVDALFPKTAAHLDDILACPHFVARVVGEHTLIAGRT